MFLFYSDHCKHCTMLLETLKSLDKNKQIKLVSMDYIKNNNLRFDQRITHRGMNRQVKDSRILVSFGFGKNNLFTDNFEKGTVQRQNAQNKFNK